MVRVIIDRKLNDSEKEVAKTALLFIEKISGQYYEPYFEDIYWSTNLIEYNGLTVYVKDRNANLGAHVILDKNIYPRNLTFLFDVIEFGEVICHELSHVFFKTKDPTTHKTVNEPIERLSLKAWKTKLSDEEIKIHNCGATNLLQKYACEVGLKIKNDPNR